MIDMIVYYDIFTAAKRTKRWHHFPGPKQGHREARFFFFATPKKVTNCETAPEIELSFGFSMF